MNKVGLITFHAAHNYGSVLQAYATQKVLLNAGYSSEVINYRLKNQLAFYNHFYSRKFGAKAFIRRIARVTEHRKRAIRRNRFERFINKKLKLTEKTYHTYDELCNERFHYSALISGSDQVWNEHCTAEFFTEPAESILGYYLGFSKDNTPKISISSSFGGMKKEEIEKYIEYLKEYRYLSVREADGARMLGELLERSDVQNTLDPTLLLTKKQWEKLVRYESQEQYVIVYTLRQYHAAIELLSSVKKVAKRNNLKVKYIAPFATIRDKEMESMIESGPEDFISLINSAALVVTDSFHGTAFSVNMQRPFYTIEHSNDNRKGLLLERLGLRNRIVTLEEFENIEDYSCDYSEVSEKLAKEREKSLTYIKHSLEGALKSDSNM